jgi:cell division septation protein DedD
MRKQEQFDAPTHQLQLNNKSRINRPVQFYDFIQKLVRLATGLISGAIIVIALWYGAITSIALWSANLIDLVGGAGINQLQVRVSEKAQQSVEARKGYINRESKAKARGDEIQAENEYGLGFLPTPAAGKAITTALTGADTNTSGTATNIDLETKSMQPTVGVKSRQEKSSRNTETWVINLASLQRKVDAEHFVVRANSKGISAEINQVTVRGKKYWRVQVPGFSSADEAKTQVGDVQNKLGLNDVWIVQR